MYRHPANRTSLAVALVLGLGLVAGEAMAQELIPRAFWPSPKGLNVAVAGFTFLEGDIVTNPALPIEGTDSRTFFLQAGYQRAFGLAGRSASVLVSVPYIIGTTKVDFDDPLAPLFPQRDVSDVGDTLLRLTVNLMGAPVMKREEFRGMAADPRPILGASLHVKVPTGAYDPDRFINAGTDRWGFKADLGYIQPLRRRWQLEAVLGIWYFTDADRFLRTRTLKQDPIWAGELHAVKIFRPGFWFAIDANFYGGGATTIDGLGGENAQRNSRIGVTMVYPLGGGHAIKASLSDSILTRSAGDFTSFTVNYQFAWQ